jgi:multimeric flavodoxin WrbA
MKVLGVNGSGRKGGNTAVLVGAILQGAREAGCETTLFELADWHIRGCSACKGCKQTQRCAIDDDMRRFYKIAPETDVLVLASPIYLDHITAQLLAFIHRTYCYLGVGLENYYPNPAARAVLGITYGAGGATTYDYVLDWMAGRLKGYFGIPTLARFKIPATTHEPIITADHPEAVRARRIGATLGQG